MTPLDTNRNRNGDRNGDGNGNGNGDGTADNPLRPEFWKKPTHEIDAFFARLRAGREPVFFPYRPARPNSGSGSGSGSGSYGFYALTRHAQITEVSRRPDVFASAPSSSTLEDRSPAFGNSAEGSLLHMDAPRHTVMRRVVARAFNPSGLRRHDGMIAAAARRVVDELLEKTPCDFVTEAAVQLPLRAICAIVGVPASAYEDVVRATDTITEIANTTDRAGLDTVAEAVTYFSTLMGDLARLRRGDPADDVTTTLVRATVDGRPLTDAELGAFLRILLVGGNDTTRSTLAHMLHLLTDNPGQKRLLLADLPGRMPGAVEETLRHATPGTWMRRNVTRDTTVDGHPLRAGDRIILYYNSANRDEDVFDRPHAFDIGRSPNPHLSFGGPSPHHCLGAHLARRETGLFYRELLTRAPGIHATAAPAHTYSGLIHGISHLPCAR
ncbi:cytochrome P450 [Streptomyces murinus]|uniref:cytochrome P450 n=1 Tax=Streptomyces murinus TaxID=33900 RepID=UPI00382ADE20